MAEPLIKTVKVAGIDKIIAKLDSEVLVQPEFDDAVGSFVKRMKRQGKGLGAKNNTITTEAKPLAAKAESTLTYPRTTGEAWTRKQVGALTAMAPRVVAKAIRRIEQRWADEALEPGGVEE